MEQEWLVIDLGGSIVAPSASGVDPDVALQTLSFFHDWLLEDETRCLGLVVGGGKPARDSLQRLDTVRSRLPPPLHDLPSSEKDWLGIRATHCNGEALRLMAAGLLDANGIPLLCQPLLTSYDKLPRKQDLGRLVIGAGWKPGFSTDYDAVLLAEYLGVSRLLCLSNIAQIYDADPATEPRATPLSHLDWESYQKMVGSEWKPGSSLPFDPVATTYAAKIGLELIFADGRDLKNLGYILEEKDFIGTVVR